jgi:hypothetical protein
VGRRCAFSCAVSRIVFGVDDKFADFIDFGFGSVLIVRSDNPTFVTVVLPPASSHD